MPLWKEQASQRMIWASPNKDDFPKARMMFVFYLPMATEWFQGTVSHPTLMRIYQSLLLQNCNFLTLWCLSLLPSTPMKWMGPQCISMKWLQSPCVSPLLGSCLWASNGLRVCLLSPRCPYRTRYDHESSEAWGETRKAECCERKNIAWRSRQPL